MDKKELIVFAVFTIIAIFILFKTVWQPEVVVIERPAPVMAPAPPAALPPVLPEIEVPVAPEPEVQPPTPQEPPFPLPPAMPPPELKPIPSIQELTPAYVEFYVNRIPVPEYFPYAHIPIKEDRIRTFSGKFGPYYEDYRDYIYVHLCSHVLGQPEMFACEKITDLNYIGGYLSFVRGYPPDEYIGNVAMRDFGAYYTVKTKTHEVLAKSNVAPIRIVHD